jgi:hypothetical protein
VIRLAGVIATILATGWALFFGMLGLPWYLALFPPSPPMGGAEKLYYDASYDKLAEPSTASLANCSGTASTGDRLGHLQLDIARHPIPEAAAHVLIVCGTSADLEPWSQEQLDAGALDARLAQFGTRVRDNDVVVDPLRVFIGGLIATLALGPLMLVGLAALLYRRFYPRKPEPSADGGLM